MVSTSNLRVTYSILKSKACLYTWFRQSEYAFYPAFWSGYELGYLSTDGTKIKANASNNNSLSEEQLKRLQDIIEKGIKIDEEEDKIYGDKRGDELPPELDTQEKIRKKIEEIEQSQGKRLKRAAKTIIEAHTTGDENQK